MLFLSIHVSSYLYNSSYLSPKYIYRVIYTTVSMLKVVYTKSTNYIDSSFVAALDSSAASSAAISTVIYLSRCNVAHYCIVFIYVYIYIERQPLLTTLHSVSAHPFHIRRPLSAPVCILSQFFLHIHSVTTLMSSHPPHRSSTATAAFA